MVRALAGDGATARRLSQRLIAAGARPVPGILGASGGWIGAAGEASAMVVALDGLSPAQREAVPARAVPVHLGPGADADAAFEASEANLAAFVAGLGAAELGATEGASGATEPELPTPPTGPEVTGDLSANLPLVELGPLLAAIDQGVALLDGGDRVLAHDPSSAELGRLELGARPPFELPPEGVQRVLDLGAGPVTVRLASVRWANRPVRLLRLESAREAGLDGGLAHTDRLAAVGALAAGFAHEVNNPAQAVTADLHELATQLDRVERAAADPADELLEPLAEARELLGECFEGLGRIASIVRDMKSFARVEPERVERLTANEIVHQACQLAHNQIRHRARLVKSCEATTPIAGDRTRLVQVVTNLLVNAVQAIPEDATHAVIAVRTWEVPGRVVVAVADNGPGIPPEVLGRIFKPFFTTKVNRDGTGLGLAMALDIAKAHGGTLEVETEVGRGTRFELILPAPSDGRALPPSSTTMGHRLSAAPEADEGGEAPRGRVLVIDDEPGIRRSLCRILGHRHEVDSCADGREALAKIERDPRFDVLLCDLMMPGMDGPALFEALRGLDPGLARRMIFMSGGVFTERAREFVERHRVPMLDKPTSPRSLESAIRAAMEGQSVNADGRPGVDTAGRRSGRCLAPPGG